MSIPSTIAATLERAAVNYRLLTHRHAPSLEEAARDSNIPLEQVIRAVLLKDSLGFVLAVLPLTHALDFAALNNLTGRDLQPAEPAECGALFSDCEPGAVPPLARPYRLNAIIDTAIGSLPQLCFEPGDRRILICMESEEFLRLHSKSQHAAFSLPQQNLSLSGNSRHVNTDGLQELRPLGNIAERMNHLKHLPPMPTAALQLLQLRNRGTQDIDTLCTLIRQQPEVEERLLVASNADHEAGAATLQLAIAEVLGFDAALNIALARVIYRHFNITHEGPLGATALWRQALLSARLAESLAHQLSPQLGVSPAMAHLAGLLHNVGYLAMGQQMQAEFYLLNKVVSANPEAPIIQMEKRLLGIGHTHIGAWLMRSWQMPDELIVTVREHHNELYRGNHSPYVQLMLVVGCLLKSYGIGEASSRSVPPAALSQLGLDLRQATELTEQIILQSEGPAALTNQLCA